MTMIPKNELARASASSPQSRGVFIVDVLLQGTYDMLYSRRYSTTIQDKILRAGHRVQSGSIIWTHDLLERTSVKVLFNQTSWIPRMYRHAKPTNSGLVSSVTLETAG